MRYERNRKIAGIDEYKLYKLLKILIIPAIVLVLIVVIVIADRLPKPGDGQDKMVLDSSVDTNNATNSDSQKAPDNNVYIYDFAHYGLQKDAIPEINELVAQYQKAKTTGDAELMYKIFGRNDTEGLEAMKTKLQEEMKVYEAYEDTVCYTTAGIEDNSYIVYISSKLKFDGIDTVAPMLTWAYVVKNDSGDYYMKEPDKLTDKEKSRIDEISVSEDVRVLDSDMRTQLAAAIVSDAKLAALYQLWEEGSTTDASEIQEVGDQTEVGESVAEDINASQATETTEETTIEESVQEATIKIVE